jgi:hypothetical protein
MRVRIFLLLLCLFSSVFAYSGGSGEPNDPYRIGMAADLLALRAETSDYNKCFILTADIDLDPNLPGGQIFTTAVIAHDTNNSNDNFDGNSFTGVFNGNGHTISNLTIDTGGVENDYLGLFGYTGGGEIKNLVLENVSITGGNDSYYLGGLVGDNRAIISNCYSSGDVNGGDNSYSVGGLVGRNQGNISNCYSTGETSGGDNAFLIGGLVGDNNNGNINNSCSTGTIAGGNGSSFVGGLVGWNYYGNISECNSTGDVTGTDNSQWLGGLVGGNYGSISKCFSRDSVDGETNSLSLGGLVGFNGSDGSISNCYSTGAATGGNVSSCLGGLVGGNNDGNISNCYSTGAATGETDSCDIGGLIGHDTDGSISNCYFLESSGPDNTYGEPLTDANMKKQSSFANWDFLGETANGTEDIWRICEDADYPKLAWQYISSITFPLSNAILTGNVVLTAYISEDSGGTGVNFCLREPNGGDGISIGYEDLAADFNNTTGKWEYNLDTNSVSDGNYVILAKAIYGCGIIGFSELVPVTVSNPQQVGSLQVTLGPAGAVSAGAKWRVDSGTWQNSGTTVTDLPIGSHTVNYKSITGWNTPADQNATINNGETANITGTYTRQTSPIAVTKCAVTAGSKANSDKISFSGTMGATADDFNDANAFNVIIDSNDIVNPCVLTFPIDGKTFKVKNGTYSYSKTESGVRKSFTYNVKTHKFSFSASNVDLSGLGCPLSVGIEIGDYAGAAEVNEAVVNGPKTPIPMLLMMGVENVLRVDTCKVKQGIKPNSDQLSVKGAFAVKDADVNMTDRVSEGLVITLDTQHFTIPANKLKAGKGTFSCSNVKITDPNATATATFNFNSCAFTLTIKGANIPIISGAVDLGVAFAGYNEVDQVTLP